MNRRREWSTWIYCSTQNVTLATKADPHTEYGRLYITKTASSEFSFSSFSMKFTSFIMWSNTQTSLAYPRCAAESTVHFMVIGAGLVNIWCVGSNYENCGRQRRTYKQTLLYIVRLYTDANVKSMSVIIFQARPSQVTLRTSAVKRYHVFIIHLQPWSPCPCWCLTSAFILH